MAARKAHIHRQRSDGKTQFVRELPRAPKVPVDPGMKEQSQPVGKKIPAFLADTFSQKGWNR